jgi:hypothetical protein
MWGLTPRFANAKADLPPSEPREFFPPIKRGPGLGVAPANLDLSVRSAEASGDVPDGEAVLDALPLANEARPADRLLLGAGSAEDHVAGIELLAERREARNGLGLQTAIGEFLIEMPANHAA